MHIPLDYARKKCFNETVSIRNLRGIITIFFIASLAIASYFVAIKLSQNSGLTPNAPSSNPFAKESIDGETGLTRPAKPNSTPTPQKSRRTNSSSSSPVAVPTPVISTSPPPSVAVGKFGYDYGNGEIAGTYACNRPGGRCLVDLPATKIAAQEYAVANADRIVNLPQAEIIAGAGPEFQQKIATCGNNLTCIAEANQEATSAYLSRNLIFDEKIQAEIRDARTESTYQRLIQSEASPEEIKTSLAEAGLSPSQITSKQNEISQKQTALANYNNPQFIPSNTCGDSLICKREDVLLAAGFKSDEVNSLKSKFQSSQAYSVAVKIRQDKILSNKTDSELAKEFCKDNPARTSCEKSFKPELIFADLGLDSSNADLKKLLDQRTQTLTNKVQQDRDITLAQLYSDPLKASNAQLAKEYCQTNSKCYQEFNVTDFLKSIKDPEIAQTAATNRFIALNNLITVIVPLINSGQQLPSAYNQSVKSEVVALNNKINNAQAAYLIENRQSKNPTTDPRYGQTMTQSDRDLLIRFQNLIYSDISQIDIYATKFDQNNYQKYTNLGIYKIDPSKEFNIGTKAQIDQINFTQPIVGLTDNSGRVVTWSTASETYKQQARDLACKNDKQFCVGKPSKENPISPDEYARRITIIDNQIAALNYLQKVYDFKVGKDSPLFTGYSSLATFDNPNIPSSIKNKLTTAAVTDDLLLKSKPGQSLSETSGYSKTELDSALSGGAIKSQMISEEVRNKIEYELNRYYVTENYNTGPGAAVTIGAAFAGTAVAGPVGGALAALLVQYVPTGNSTAAELAASHQQYLDKFKYEPVANIVESFFQTQGALCDTADGLRIGGSCNVSNSFTNYNSTSLAFQQFNEGNGATIGDLFFNPVLQSELSTISFVNQQRYELNKTNQNFAVAMLPVNLVINYVGGKVGENIIMTGVKPLVPTLFQVGQDIAVGLGQGLTQSGITKEFINTPTEIAREQSIRQTGISTPVIDEQIAADQKAEATSLVLNSIGGAVSGNLSNLLAGAAAAKISGSSSDSNPSQTPRNYNLEDLNTLLASHISSNDSVFPSRELVSQLNQLDSDLRLNPKFYQPSLTPPVDLAEVTQNNIIRSLYQKSPAVEPAYVPETGDVIYLAKEATLIPSENNPNSQPPELIQILDRFDNVEAPKTRSSNNLSENAIPSDILETALASQRQKIIAEYISEQEIAPNKPTDISDHATAIERAIAKIEDEYEIGRSVETDRWQIASWVDDPTTNLTLEQRALFKKRLAPENFRETKKPSLPILTTALEKANQLLNEQNRLAPPQNPQELKAANKRLSQIVETLPEGRYAIRYNDGLATVQFEVLTDINGIRQAKQVNSSDTITDTNLSFSEIAPVSTGVNSNKQTTFFRATAIESVDSPLTTDNASGLTIISPILTNTDVPPTTPSVPDITGPRSSRASERGEGITIKADQVEELRATIIDTTKEFVAKLPSSEKVIDLAHSVTKRSKALGQDIFSRKSFDAFTTYFKERLSISLNTDPKQLPIITKGDSFLLDRAAQDPAMHLLNNNVDPSLKPIQDKLVEASNLIRQGKYKEAEVSVLNDNFLNQNNIREGTDRVVINHIPDSNEGISNLMNTMAGYSNGRNDTIELAELALPDRTTPELPQSLQKERSILILEELTHILQERNRELLGLEHPDTHPLDMYQLDEREVAIYLEKNLGVPLSEPFINRRPESRSGIGLSSHANPKEPFTLITFLGNNINTRTLGIIVGGGILAQILMAANLIPVLILGSNSNLPTNTPSPSPTPTAIISIAPATPTPTLVVTILPTATPFTPSPTPTKTLTKNEFKYYSQNDYPTITENGKVISFGPSACGYSVDAMIVTKFGNEIDPIEVRRNPIFSNLDITLDESFHLEYLNSLGIKNYSPRLSPSTLLSFSGKGTAKQDYIVNDLSNGAVLWMGLLKENNIYDKKHDHQVMLYMDQGILMLADPNLPDKKPIPFKDSPYLNVEIDSTNMIYPSGMQPSDPNATLKTYKNQ